MTSDLDFIKKDLRKRLSSSRYQHCMNVMNMAEKLARRWGADVEKCRLAGLVHDCGKLKDMEEILKLCRDHKVYLNEDDNQSPKVIHAILGEKLAEDLYGIKDPEILHAIRKHTTGERDMTLVDKIIFLADFIEPGRVGLKFEDVRADAFADIDKAMQKAYDYCIKKIIKQGEILHVSTIRGRNQTVINIKQKEAVE